MNKIKVHLFETRNLFHTHVEIFLEQKNKDIPEYYSINRWRNPEKKANSDTKEFTMISSRAFKSICFEIDGVLNEIIHSWNQEYQKYSDVPAELCFNNCADVTAWFLKKYAKIQIPSRCSAPITCNYVTCGLFAPSFLQCCTTPGRVMDYTEKFIQEYHDKDDRSELTLINVMSR